MQSTSIRAKFIQFFQQKGHQLQEAVPIVNRGDPSLLFVNAGMNPFKDIILGNRPILRPRVVSAQPCLRVTGKHNDLEAVGLDTYHHTLFEMLGNWSFGDYAKKEAIQWAWLLLTEVYQLAEERLYVTVFSGDQQDNLLADHETVAIWANYLPKTHILPFSRRDNFWEMGAQGPCGPCTEIHIDIRSDAERQAISAADLVNKDHPHVLELWNLVFMQYDRKASGMLVELPLKHIDTGMGFERLSMVLQGKMTTYDTDVFTPLIQEIVSISGKKYNKSPTISIAMRVVADHVRAVAFAIADGVLPASTKEGYVVRRILRRAIRYGYSYLAIGEPFIYTLIPILIAQMGDVYPNLTLPQLSQAIYDEEITFLKTLSAGLQRFNQLVPQNLSQSVLKGSVAFELYDTYGFPLDLTKLIAQESHLMVDEIGFEQALQAQKMRSQQDAEVCYGDWNQLKSNVESQFIGYDQLVVTTSIVQWRTLFDKEGKRYQLVLALTPFYPEGGGQVADIGVLVAGKEVIDVLDVQREHGLIVHTVARLPMQLEGEIEASVDARKRAETSANHTATHLLQAALKALLGDHIMQKGSLVRPESLRFDFTHSAKLTAEQITAVASMVNAKIRSHIPLREERSMPLEQAKAIGAQALFGEKYGAKVRVVVFDEEFSMELCGGTHVEATGHIGFFKIISEKAIGSGVRRIEAVTANRSEYLAAKESATLAALSTLLREPKDLVQAVKTLILTQKALDLQCRSYQLRIVNQLVQTLPVEQVAGIDLVVQAVVLPHAEALKQLALKYKSRYEKIFIVLATEVSDKAYMVIAMSDLLSAACNAHELMQIAAPLIGGRGGGQSSFAIAGGSNPAGISEALQAARKLFLQAYCGVEDR